MISITVILITYGKIAISDLKKMQSTLDEDTERTLELQTFEIASLSFLIPSNTIHLKGLLKNSKEAKYVKVQSSV